MTLDQLLDRLVELVMAFQSAAGGGNTVLAVQTWDDILSVRAQIHALA